MADLRIRNVSRYQDRDAVGKGEPGMWNSYCASLMTVLCVLGDEMTPAWLMGVSGWAFRLIVHKNLCPSATSVFDWYDILPESVQQVGRNCTQITRLWCEDDKRAERQAEAHQAILAGLEKGVPAIAWDLTIPEWELIVGYDTSEDIYEVVSCMGQDAWLPRTDLGDREVKILSATVVGGRNDRARHEIVRDSLQVAVRHAREEEWLDRPDYLDGLPAYGQWANAIEPGYAGEVNWDFTTYYAANWVGARCYARDYLVELSHEYPGLAAAAATYSRVADELLPVWQAFSQEKCPPDVKRTELSGRLRRAGEIERQGVEQLAAFLKQIDQETN